MQVACCDDDRVRRANAGSPGGQQAPDIRAAGVVVSRQIPGEPREYAIIHRPHRGDWTLPKGKLDPGETWPLAAVREVHEETGLDVVLGPPLPPQMYLVDGLLKEVRYWRSADVVGDFIPNDEVDELRWLAAKDARKLLTYSHDRGLIDVVEGDGNSDLQPMLVVRHAHAGDGAAWLREGQRDEDRPLSSIGQGQVSVIAALARAYGTRAVVTSPAARCQQTVAGLKDDVRWATNDWLYNGADIGSAGFEAVVAAAVGSSEPLVVCAHGEQVDWLARQAGATPRKFRKGGVCVLWRTPGTLTCRAWEYYDTYPESLPAG